MTTASMIIIVATLTTLYAITLEIAGHHRWTPDWTWVEVCIGVALVGGCVWLRLTATLPLDITTPEAAAIWAWWIWFWAFCAGGAPIIAWQVAVMARAHRDAHTDALRLLRKASYDSPSPMAERGGDTAAAVEDHGQ